MKHGRSVDRFDVRRQGRNVTPAIAFAAVFTAACAILSVGFVTTRGGLALPLALPVATDVTAVVPTSTAEPMRTAPIPTPTPSPSPLPPSVLPSPQPSPSPATATPVATEPPAARTQAPDPLTALPACPDHPGCYEYLIRRGDTLSGVASRYAIPVSTVIALNPQLSDASTIVVGEVLYLGRSPFLRLDPCGGLQGCYLYTVRPGDLVSTIAFRFGISVASLLEANPSIADVNAIYSGQVIRLLEPALK